MTYVLKINFIILSFLLTALDLPAQQKLNAFIEDLKTTDEFAKSKIPIGAIKRGLSMDIRQYDIEKGVQELSEYMLKATHYMTEIDDMNVEKIKSILTGHKKKLIRNDKFSEWMTIENESEDISLLFLEKNEEISKVIVICQNAGKVQLYEFNTKIPASQFTKIFRKKEMKRI